MGNNTTKQSEKRSKWYKQDLFVERNLNFSTWMSDFSEYIKETRLLDLNLIRAHQSATYCINSYFEKVSICQHQSIYYQLYGGVRVLDLRPGSYEPDMAEISCGHGPHRATRIEEVFNQVKNFLLDHPKEFVIIEMETAGKFFGLNHELSGEKKAELIQLIDVIFDKMLVRKGEEWFDIEKVTLGKLWEYKKRIMIISHSFIRNDILDPDFIFDMFTYEYGRYANTKCRNIMKKHVGKFIHTAQDELSPFYNQFLSVNLQLTPQAIDNVFELNASLHQDEFVYDWVISLLKQGCRLNIVSTSKISK